MITGFLGLLCTLIFLVVGIYTNTIYNCIRRVYINDGSEGDKNENLKEYKQAPGPIPWPFIGNLALLSKFKVPLQGLTQLSEELGDIYSLTLGTRRCLVVSSLNLIREVLNQKGKFFGGRPNFLRYHKLFGGDRNNSLALSDWSSLQQKRRNLARRHCSPRNSSLLFTKMSNVACYEVCVFMNALRERLSPHGECEIKSLIQQTSANMFLQYMCSIRFDYNDNDFKKVVECFDEIFWDINKGYALDFLPWLAPFYKKHLNTIVGWSTAIRKFIIERIISQREHMIDVSEPEQDFADALLKNSIEDKSVSRDTIIYMLEDFIGGHSAIGNLLMAAFAHIVHNQDVAKKIQAEADEISSHGRRIINIYDMEKMPYTMATISEVLRFSSSPIVPHVATEDTVVAGYGITKDTIVIINNYKLNRSAQYWENPDFFQPERFLENTNIEKSEMVAKRRNSEGSDSGIEFDKEDLAVFKKNSTKHRSSTQISNMSSSKRTPRLKKNIPHFLPFGIGKRTCIGQSLVRGFGFVLLANILQRFNVSSCNLSSVETIPACIALPPKTFSLQFRFRNIY
ncbi:cytochrome P450 307a1 [Stomoxys calcitrans]|uniref:Cytochrome P450 307a1-like n=1 Tax=Stomoxys calcitrans TaxID=35570 RepID=A0A1I8Q4J4_STOCA|nr:cytochrome P450 307a1 [Stomoxys calcitrans]